MAFILHPWQLCLAILAGWVNRQQQEVIEYLRTENQVLKEKLGKKRVLLNDDQRRRLAVNGFSADVGRHDRPIYFGKRMFWQFLPTFIATVIAATIEQKSNSDQAAFR